MCKLSIGKGKIKCPHGHFDLYKQIFDKLCVFGDEFESKFWFFAHKFRYYGARFFSIFGTVVGSWG